MSSLPPNSPLHLPRLTAIMPASIAQRTPMLNLLPIPRTVTPVDGAFTLHEQGSIVLEGPGTEALLPAARRLQAALDKVDQTWHIAEPADAAIYLRLEQGAAMPPQGYALSILPERVLI